MDWHEKKEVKKGDIGEEIVKEFLEKNDFILYRPVTNGAHKIDYFAHSGKGKRVICCEVKAKRRMARFPLTGFNVSNYTHYKEMYEKHKIDTFVFFVDDFEGWVYGQWLNILGEGKIIKGRQDVIVWPLSSMKKIKQIDADILKDLSKYTTEKYDYSNTPKFF